ncbi:MAG TPA: aldose 1-epimerase family protein [Micromonosporaceae bacterium]
MREIIRPSGAQWTIASGDHHATIVEVGGGLRRYRVGDVDVVDGYGEDELCPGGAGQVLAPWPNRLRDGRYVFDGKTHQLALSEPATHAAIHGLVRWLPWQRVGGSESEITVACLITAQPGYPWPVELRTTWSLDADGLTVRHEATNLGDASCPWGLGVHPYLMLPGVAVDDLVLQVPARSRLLVDGRKLPIGAAKVAGGEFDYTTPRRIGGAHLDTAFGDLDRGGDGRTEVTVSAPHLDRSVAIWADEAFSWWQVYTGDTLPPHRARRAVAVEAMTCPPDAFHSGRDVVVLRPGRTWRGTWGIRPSR